MLNSTAYKELNHAAAHALPYFLGKPKIPLSDPQLYLVEFTFPYDEGKKCGFAYSTFSKVIRELVKKGFIDPIDKGGLRSDGKSYNLFRLSKRWEKCGTQDFEPIEWECFQPRLRQKATPKKEINSSKKGKEMTREIEKFS